MKRMAPETPTARIQTDRAMFMGFRIHSLNLSHRELQSILFTKGTVKRLDAEDDGL
jgi:hypothetical protein